MIFLDSWIFIEYFATKNEKIIKLIEENTNIMIISSVCITEIKYKLSKKYGALQANEIITLINNIQNLKILSVTAEIAELAADLRLKYYSKKNELSFIDAINLATAIMTRCDAFYTGDPDFEDVKEIKIEIVR